MKAHIVRKSTILKKCAKTTICCFTLTKPRSWSLTKKKKKGQETKVHSPVLITEGEVEWVRNFRFLGSHISTWAECRYDCICLRKSKFACHVGFLNHSPHLYYLQELYEWRKITVYFKVEDKPFNRVIMLRPQLICGDIWWSDMRWLFYSMDCHLTLLDYLT